MNAIVAQFAIPEVPEPMPIVMDQILVVRLHRRGTHPKVPVEPCGRLLWLFEPDRVPATRKEKVRLIHVADVAGMDEFDRPAEPAPPAPLRSSGGDPVVLAGSLD